MDKPRRYQRLRAKGWKMPPNSVVVSRPSKWGNPFRAGFATYPNEAEARKGPPLSMEDAVERYRYWMSPLRDGLGIESLRGKNLVCWCRIDFPCHADVLLEWANG